ncbi:MAG: 50S ribosomal protein L21 [bacterium]|nr:50S ribosomal protein L21 [bacterium]
MKYAVIKHNGRQFKVSEGDVITVEGANIEKNITFSNVLATIGDSVKFGSPFIDGAVVKGTVISEGFGPKIKVRKFKAKSNYHKTIGYRSKTASVRIDSI